MAEPVTILSIINGSLEIALKIGQVVNDLREIAQKVKHAELELQSTIEECRVIQTASGGIEKWARKADVTVERELLERLDQSLMFGVILMSALETDLAKNHLESDAIYATSKPDKDTGRGHDPTTASHQPASEQGSHRITCKRKRDRYSRLVTRAHGPLVNSRASMLSRRKSLMSIESSERICKPLPFENDLFTARVYKRNYRPRLVQRMLKPADLPSALVAETSAAPSQRPSNPKVEQLSIPPRSRRKNMNPIYSVIILGSPESGTAAFRSQFCDKLGVGETDLRHESFFRRIHTIDSYNSMIEMVGMGGVNGAYAASRTTSAEAAILLYSITSRSSFEHLRNLHDEIMQFEYTQPPIALVGNDIEKQCEREVSTMEGKAWARELRCNFFETSAENRVNVAEPIAEMVRKQRKQRRSYLF